VIFKAGFIMLSPHKKTDRNLPVALHGASADWRHVW
jgi:hypothetical protein